MLPGRQATVYSHDAEGNLFEKQEKSGRRWRYKWKGNGMLESVMRPDQKLVSFEYDALGRRTAKIYHGQITRWVWNGHVPLHEWTYPLPDRPVKQVGQWGQVTCDPERVVSPTTWVFDEGSFTPAAKITADETYSIISDYLGTPIELYNSKGQRTWAADYDIYGKIRNLNDGSLDDCPFRYPGQYEDLETGLYYNRFRYYSPEEGMYLSQDPIGLSGGKELYGYVRDVHVGVDVWGLSECGHAEVKKGIEDILQQYKPTITKLDPLARIGFRGSASKGVKGKHKGFAPFDPTDFDIDAFIISDKLYNLPVFHPSDWWRSGAKIPVLEDLQEEIHTSFAKRFPGYRINEEFTFRIYQSSKIISGATIL